MTQPSPANIFYALVPPPAVLQPLIAALVPLRKGANRVAWVSPQRWHVTLAFLGPVEYEPLVGRSWELPAVGVLTVAGAGTFGSRVLWAGVRGALDEVVSAVRRQASLQAETRRPAGEPDAVYQPHITLGRARGRLGWSGLRRIAATLDYPAQCWQPDRVVLMRSRPGQPYERLAEWPLGGRPASR